MRKRTPSLGRVRGSFWKKRRVLITGATGFVGSSLAARLADLGARVTGLAKDPVPESSFEKQGLKGKIRLIRGDLADWPFVERTLRRHPVEIVYHLAAQAIVGKANQSPRETFRSNIEGTWNLLEACRDTRSLRAVIVASSDKAYGAHRKLPYREDFPLRPQFPYDVSKACAELVARSYFFTYGLPVVVTRFANLYGPGDMNFSRIIPDTIRSILAGRRPVIRSDGTPERDYLFIDDAVDLYLLLAQRIDRTKGEVFNAGHNQPVRVLQVVETLLRLAGRSDLKPKILGKGTPHGEIDRQWLDGAKAKRMVGWSPDVELEAGLKKTLAWYATYPKTPR